MSEDSPKRQHLWTGIAGAIFTAILMIVLLNYRETKELVCGRWTAKIETADQSCIRNYIFDFQTLITGILAVAAAYFTVKQMQETDRQAQRRHEDQMNLQTRPIKLKLERKIIPAIRLFQTSSEHLKRVEYDFGKDLPSLQAKFTDYVRSAGLVAATSVAVFKETHDREWSDTIELFDAKLHRCLSEACLQSQALIDIAIAVRDCKPGERIPRGDAMADKEFEITNYPTAVYCTYQALDELIDGLKSLAEVYSINIYQ